MDRLPAEMLHAVFELLPPSDIANARLTCNRFFHTIGNRYLLPEVHMIYTEESFERLQETSANERFGQHITSLFIEGDMTLPVRRQDLWRDAIRHIYSLGEPNRLIESPTSTAHERILASYNSVLNKFVRGQNHLSDDDFAVAYQNFKRNYLAQEDFYKTLRDSRLRSILEKLPHITTISLSLLGGIGPRTSALDRAFSDGIFPAIGDNSGLTPYANEIAPVHDILSSALGAGLVLRGLHLGYVDWTCLRIQRTEFIRLKPVLGNLRALTLLISTGHLLVDATNHQRESQACDLFLRDFLHLHYFIKAAPNLSELKIHFLWEKPCPADLYYIVGTFTWPSLRKVDLSCIETSEDVMIDFFRRHAPTLRHVALDRIKMMHGTWSSALPKLRKMLTLDSVSLSGDMYSREPTEYWYLDTQPSMHQWEATRQEPLWRGT
ncbi:hypothetical protein MMC14_006006 [Varicellaria rhodocarpa]|nr:hypothetical protein [Varicellaria rhodocarpa]